MGSHDVWIKRSAVFLIAVVSISAGILSWNGLTFLAVQSGIPESISFLFAITVDGLILLAGAETVSATMSSRSVWYGWLLTAIGVGLSITGNIMSVSSHSAQAQWVHALPPVILFLSVELLLRIIKHRISVETMEAEAAARAALRDQKRKERETVQVSSSPTPVVRSVAGKGQDPESCIQSYRDLISSMAEGSSKASQIEAVLMKFPDARNVHIAKALGVETKTVATTITRVRERLAAAQKTNEAFTEIVKESLVESGSAINN